jgi:S-disulfanyl-L-cysteine oxidoreductase SoxD
MAAAMFTAIAAGCGGVPLTSVPYTGPPEDQRSSGADAFGEACASCHGANGEGGDGGPALIGAKALPIEPSATAKTRKTKLGTAQDLFTFVNGEMPPLAPGSLGDDRAWAVVAHLVRENGVDWGKDDLGPKNAASIKLHR